MKFMCPFCDGNAHIPIPLHTIVDGDILWGTCEDCGKEASIDIIITSKATHDMVAAAPSVMDIVAGIAHGDTPNPLIKED